MHSLSDTDRAEYSALVVLIKILGISLDAQTMVHLAYVMIYTKQYRDFDG